MTCIRPWEAPEQMLADAGVELGVTYPYPVISQQESEEHLNIAAKVIQETLAASIAASQVRRFSNQRWLFPRHHHCIQTSWPLFDTVMHV